MCGILVGTLITTKTPIYFVAGHKSKHNSRLRKKGADLSELQSAIGSIKQTQDDINR